MRIPVYRAQGQLASTMPGRQIRARKSVSAAQQAEMAKASPGMALSDAIGEYAQTRYKMQVENDLNSAMLDAQEALRERRRELAKDPNYNKVLDGNDPIWDKETKQLEQDLRAKVGKDRYALQQFESRFRQLEQQNRFALRDSIDRRVEVAAAQNRARKLNDAQKEIAEGTDLAQVSFIFRDIVQDTKKLAEIKAGNLDVLTAQQREMLVRAVYGALEKNANEAESGSQFIERIRVALEQGVGVGASEKGREAGGSVLKTSQEAYVYGLLKLLDPNEQVRILKSVGSDQAYLEGPTLAEIHAQKLSQTYADQFNESLDIRTESLSDGTTSTRDQMLELENGINSILPTLPPAEAEALRTRLTEFQELNNFQVGLNRVASKDGISQVITSLQNGIKGKGLSGIDTEFEKSALKLATDFQTKFNAAIQPDGDIIDFADKTKMDGIYISPVDLSVSNVSPDALDPRGEVRVDSGIQTRINEGIKIASRNGLDFIPVLKKSEMQEVVANIDGLAGMDATAYLQQVTAGLDGKSASILIENMANLGLAPEYVQAFYMSNKQAAADLIEIKDVEIGELKDAVRKDQSTGAAGIPTVMGNLSALDEYAQAYISGGDGDAAFERFSQQRDLAEKLAFFYVSKGETVSKGVEKAVEAIFDSEAMIGANEQYLVPRNFNPDKVSKAANALLTRDGLSRFKIDPLSDERLKVGENVDVNVASLISNGMWLNNGTGDGLVLHYNLNGTFLPVRTTDGKVLEQSFKELQDLNLRSIVDVTEEFETGGETIPLRDYDTTDRREQAKAAASFVGQLKDEFADEVLAELGDQELKDWADQNGFKYNQQVLNLTKTLLKQEYGE